MKAYPTQEQLRERFEYKDGQLIYKIKPCKRINIGDVAGCICDNAYRDIMINNKVYKAHRLIWIMHNGNIQEDMNIDHINQIKHDNRIENLRLATPSENKCNTIRYKTNTSGYKGVLWCKQKKKWKAQIRHNYKNIYLGLRDTPEAAYELYIAAAKELHGEFACTE